MFVFDVMTKHVGILEYSFVCILLNQNFSSLLVQLEVPVESDQSFGEQASPGNASHSTVLSTDASLQEENNEDTESSSVTVRTEEPAAATGSIFDFCILIFNAFLETTGARCFMLFSVTNKLCFLVMQTAGENENFYFLCI